jgi:multidrug resistance efflux pump
MQKEPSGLFRKEALRHSSGRSEGDILRLSSPFTERSYWLLVAAFIGAMIYAFVGRIHEYASGPAIVWMTGRKQITATNAGTVHEIYVRSGQFVEAGHVIAQFHSSVEKAEVHRIQREFDLQLVKTLRDPSDQPAREALTSLRAQKDLAIARLEQLTIRAPEAGTIGDVRIYAGQRLAAGDTVVTLSGDRHSCSILAMLPAHYRPQLRPGMKMSFEVTGYRFAYQELTITSVGAEIIGPAEVKRHVGQEIADTFVVTGPVVFVEGTPSDPSFRVAGQSFPYFHGMNGVGEARVRSEPIIVTLIPALRYFFEKLHV